MKPSVFATLKRAEDFARHHGDTALANDLYGLGCMLGGPTEMPPYEPAAPKPEAVGQVESISAAR